MSDVRVSGHVLRPFASLLLAVAVLLALVPPVAHGQEGHERIEVTIEGAGGTPIAASIYRPAGASADAPVPVIVHSHGWGGSRTSSDGAFRNELDRGFGVLSFDQRGFGQSGGQAHVQDPELEGRDVIAVIDHLAGLDWVAKDVDADGQPVDDDPVLFATGGSYGGGFQFVGALTEIRDSATLDEDGAVTVPGRTRFNAIAPDIAWFDLSQSLAPEGVVRTAWALLLYSVGIPVVAPHIHEGFVYGASTGQWPDGTVPGIADLDTIFHTNGPSGFVAEGHQLDIPALITQGFSDNLFNGNEGVHNFERTLTDAARERSLFVGYNGGHALPNVVPAGVAGSTDACRGTSAAMRLDFFEAVLEGEDPSALMDAPYNVTTIGDTCVQVESLAPTTSVDVVDLVVGGRMLSPTGVGVAQHRELLTGPATVAGIPQVRAEVTSLGVEQRMFFGLSVGTSPLNARVIHNNLMPLREPLPVVDEARTIELPAIAVELGEGESLFLTATPLSDMSFGHGSLRTPGVISLADLIVDLPLVLDDEGDPGEGDPGEGGPGEGEPGAGDGDGDGEEAACRPGNRPDRMPDAARDCPPGRR